MQFVSRDPSKYVPPTMVDKDVDAMYDDFVNHLVLAKARSIVAPSKWSYAYGYVHWYFRVSHSYMTPYIKGEPPRLAHIIEEAA